MPRCTILITTFLRDNLLPFTLGSLLKQEPLQDGQAEILVLNDALPGYTEEICKEHGVRYLHTGDTEKLHWRIPGYALNMGAKVSDAKYIIITCAEIFHIDPTTVQDTLDLLDSGDKVIAVTEGKHDTRANYLEALTKTGNHSESIYHKCNGLKTHLPFFLGISRKHYLDIGGYDEDLIGQAWDDNDIVDRLVAYGCKYKKAASRVIHLWHSREGHGREMDKRDRWEYNKKLYEARKGMIYRNPLREMKQL